jgi:hypothetical protein
MSRSIIVTICEICNTRYPFQPCPLHVTQVDHSACRLKPSSFPEHPHDSNSAGRAYSYGFCTSYGRNTCPCDFGHRVAAGNVSAVRMDAGMSRALGLASNGCARGWPHRSIPNRRPDARAATDRIRAATDRVRVGPHRSRPLRSPRRRSRLCSRPWLCCLPEPRGPATSRTRLRRDRNRTK